MSMTIGKRTEIQEKKHMMKVLLKDLGLHETLTYSLTSPSLVHDFNIFHDQEPVKLAMPLGEERSVTRQYYLSVHCYKSLTITNQEI